MPATPQEPGVVLSKRAAEQIAKTVREVSRRTMNELPHRSRYMHLGSASQIIEGLVSSCLGDGWYEVEVAEFTMDPPAAVGSGEDPCDLCDLVDISEVPGSACESPQVVSVSRTLPTGTGTFVSAHDTRTVPLKDNGHVRMMPIHKSSTGEQLYAIVSGQYQMAKSPFPDYDCCDSVTTMVGCEWVVGEGIPCVAWRRECPS